MENLISPSGPVMAATLLDDIGLILAQTVAASGDTTDHIQSSCRDTLATLSERFADTLERHPFGVGPVAVELCSMLVDEIRNALTTTVPTRTISPL